MEVMDLLLLLSCCYLMVGALTAGIYLIACDIDPWERWSDTTEAVCVLVFWPAVWCVVLSALIVLGVVCWWRRKR